MKKSKYDLIQCTLTAVIKLVMLILSILIVFLIAMNLVYKNTDRQKISSNISADLAVFKDIYNLAMYNDNLHFNTLQTLIEYNGDIICLLIAKDSNDWVSLEYEKAEKVWLSELGKSDNGVSATLASWKFMSQITGLNRDFDLHIISNSELRYWNGIEIILKSMLSMMTFTQLVYTLVIIEWLLFIALLYRIHKLIKLMSIGYKNLYFVLIACVFVGTNLFLIYNWPTRMMVPIITIISLHLLLLICTKYKDSRYVKLSHILILYAVTGSVICILDYIYSPILLILTLLMIEYSIIDRAYSIDSEDSIFIKMSKPIMWFCGYFGTWIAKFILVYVYNRELFATILNKASDWSVLATDKIKYLLEYLFLQFGFILIALVIMLTIMLYISYKTGLNLKEFLIILRKLVDSTGATMIIVFLVWNVVFAYHTYWHVHFTFGLIQYFIYLTLLNSIYKRSKIID